MIKGHDIEAIVKLKMETTGKSWWLNINLVGSKFRQLRSSNLYVSGGRNVTIMRLLRLF